MGRLRISKGSGWQRILESFVYLDFVNFSTRWFKLSLFELILPVLDLLVNFILITKINLTLNFLAYILSAIKLDKSHVVLIGFVFNWAVPRFLLLSDWRNTWLFFHIKKFFWGQICLESFFILEFIKGDTTLDAYWNARIIFKPRWIRRGVFRFRIFFFL